MKNQKIKQDEAQKRAKGWQSLSLVDQLKALDKRLGKGNGATKQRAKIHKRIREQIEEQKK